MKRINIWLADGTEGIVEVPEDVTKQTFFRDMERPGFLRLESGSYIRKTAIQIFKFLPREEEPGLLRFTSLNGNVETKRVENWLSVLNAFDMREKINIKYADGGSSAASAGFYKDIELVTDQDW